MSLNVIEILVKSLVDGEKSEQKISIVRAQHTGKLWRRMEDQWGQEHRTDL